MKNSQENKKKYFFCIVDVMRDNWRGHEEVRIGNSDMVRLWFDSIQDCLTVINLSRDAKGNTHEAWQIFESDNAYHQDTPVLETPIITTCRAEEKAKREASTIAKYKEAEELNTKPRFTITKFADCYIVMERSIATFNPQQSGAVHVFVDIIIINQAGKTIDFSPEHYIAKGTKSILHQKLEKELMGWRGEMSKFAIQKLDGILKDIIAMERNLTHGNCSTAVDREIIRKRLPDFIANSDPKCYQPSYDEKLWGEKDFNSSMAYHNKDNAKKDFPSLYIETVSQASIKDLVYVDHE
jgi:hypothetical protein